MRISSLQYMYNYKTALNKAYKNQTKLFEQADGSKLHRGSDDPVAYSRFLRYNVSKAENEQYQRDVENGVSIMKTADATLSNMLVHSKTFVEKTVQAANTYNTSADFESIAKEMYSCIEEIVSLSNTQQGDRYIFSGQKDITEPFTMSEEYYNRALSKTLDAAQTKFFKGQVSEGDSYVYQMLHLEDDDGEYYLDTENGYIYTKKFLEEGYKELVTMDYTVIKEDDTQTKSPLVKGAIDDADNNEETKALLQAGIVNYGTPIDVSDTDTFTVSMYINNKGVVTTDQISFSVPDTDDEGNATTSTKTLKISSVYQQIVTYSGDTNNISMVKRNGANDNLSDVVNVTGVDVFAYDIFDNDVSGNDYSGSAYLNDMITVYQKVLAGDEDWLTSDGVTLANAAHNSITLAQTTIGSRIQLYEDVHNMLTSQNETITEDITNVSGVDVAELATRLMEMTSIYNMSLSMGGRILPVSLADYL
ncbi:MAG: flagellar hook-associated protein FlgL [Selenomonadaceae bacterium]|nr:flagellar hook-associated protein FlgL [Selenomonadaceae bacterium]